MAAKNKEGFTILEAVIVVSVLAILLAASSANFIVFKKKYDLDGSVSEVAGVLRLAHVKSLAAQQNSRYGVYFDTAASPQKYILFKGQNYAARDIASDQIYIVAEQAEFSAVNFNGGSEVAFERMTGYALPQGTVSLRLKNDATQTKTIYILDSGAVGFEPPSSASDNERVKDSRHIHFDYGRVIDVNSEKIKLTFNGNVIREVPIASNMTGGQFLWEGETDVGGSAQKIKIQTHRLNNIDSQFSVSRDRRYNDKSLKIEISGDSSGGLAEYSADGLSTNFSSIFVSNFAWQ